MAGQVALDLEDQRLLNKTIKIRENVIDQLMEGGKLPSDKDDQRTLMASLDGIDKAVIGRARVRNEENSNNSKEKTNDLVANMLARTLRQNQQPANSADRVLPSDVSPGEIVPGNTDIGTVNVNPDDFLEY